ncbi:hypothetical protein F4778DRAFT_51314 [Xylariomycetidae sp. FL2044]|nr:hypothetical protein F4778DRAFT_51314 [Xylariomycetidae sp. FL2044]
MPDSPHTAVSFSKSTGPERPELRAVVHSFHCTHPGCDVFFESAEDLDRHQRLPHAPGHHVVSEEPFRCKCDDQFTRMSSLKRHIKNHITGGQRFECDRCDTYIGQNAFGRKDHLIQHLRVKHRLGDREVTALFPRVENPFTVPLLDCRFEGCEYHRDDSSRNLKWEEQRAYLPFSKRSDYTKHMRKEHDWSPFPCDIPGCKQVGGKGYFAPAPFEKHRRIHHPQAAPVHFRTRFGGGLTCGHCGQRGTFPWFPHMCRWDSISK